MRVYLPFEYHASQTYPWLLSQQLSRYYRETDYPYKPEVHKPETYKPGPGEYKE
jgi:hypothetical protein